MKRDWKYKKLGEITTTINGLWTGKNPPFVNVAVVRNTNFTKDCKLDMTNVAYLDVEQRQYNSRKLLPGDIIIEKSGGSDKQPVGRPVLFDISDGEYSFSNFTSTLRISNADEIIPKFLHYALYSAYLRGETRKLQSKTTGIHNLDFKGYNRLPIPIPSLLEQESIVTELDRINDLISLKKLQLIEFDNLAQSIFYNMFGDPVTNEKRWQVNELGKVCELKAGKNIKASELSEMPAEGLYPCFGGNGIRGYIAKKSHTGSYPIIGRQGALCGNVNMATGTFYATEHAVVCTPSNLLIPLFLFYVLREMNLNQYATGVAQPGLAVSNITPLPIVLPPIPLQQSFAARITAIENQKQRISSTIKDLETLLASRMQYWLD